MVGWLRRHQLSFAYALIVLSMMAALLGIQNEAEERRAALCRVVNDQQAVLADLLEVVLEDGDRGGLPLTKLPEFQRLDPATQDYLAALEALSGRDDPDDLDDRLRRFAEERLEPVDCENA